MPCKSKAKDDACKLAWRLSHKDDPVVKEKARMRKMSNYYNDPEKFRALRKQYYLANLERERTESRLRMREKAKSLTNEQRQRINERTKAWRLAHPDRKSDLQKRRYRNKPEEFVIRAMVARMIKIADIRKTCRSYKYIGCTPDFLRGWLQAKFREGMAWDNYGKVWVVDHVKPLAAFELRDHPDRIFEASHYTNLQPLFVEENLRKGFKIA